MKNKWRLLCAMMILALVLAACSSTDIGKEEPVDTDKPSAVETDDSETEQDIDEDTPEEDQATEGTAEEPANGERTSTDLPGEAELVKSDEQDFSLHILPNYKLTSEEPGKDVLYLDTDESVFMRIETVPTEDGTYDFLAENMKALIASSDIEPVELTDANSLPSGESIKNVQAYTINFEDGPVTYMLFEKGDATVRLTIFDSAEAKYFKDFLQMGEKITVQ